MYCYGISPIDFGWELSKTVQEMVTILSSNPDADWDEENPLSFSLLKSFLAGWEEAKRLAKEIGWEGDFRECPHVFAIPDENDFSYGFVIKHDNNGDTFVISPVPLPHLNKICFKYLES